LTAETFFKKPQPPDKHQKKKKTQAHKEKFKNQLTPIEQNKTNLNTKWNKINQTWMCPWAMQE